MANAFAKLDSNIASCCRLPLRFDQLNAETRIASLPAPGGIGHKRGARREKWVLWDPQIGDTGLLETWPEIAAMIAEFPGTPEKVHVGLLTAGEKLPVHRDGLGRKDQKRTLFEMFNRTLRFHIPLRTSDQVFMYADKKIYRMQAGECWMLNNMKHHSAVNAHPEIDRYHLILDMAPTQETFALLAAAETDLGIDDKALFDRYWPGFEML